jgi:hypothetical protein
MMGLATAATFLRPSLRSVCLFCSCGFLALNLSSVDCVAADGSNNSRHFILHEDMIREVSTPADPQACNPNEVLTDLFRQIAPVAHVYPTENYYYFRFYRGGKSYSGSLRLAADTRDNGTVEFACYETYTSWLVVDEQSGVQKDLSEPDGVLVKKIDDFAYDVEFHGVTVRFLLNRIDQTADKEILGKNEDFVGRSFDDSGIVFDLVYNRSQKTFYFVLDTKRRVDETFVKFRDKVYVGTRTGFVYFEDAVVNRYVLIAVNAEEVHNNTPYDGPFDQLPENFYKEIDFWRYVYDAYPDLVGKLTAGGKYRDAKLEIIFGLAPYREYVSEKELKFIDVCMSKNLEQPKLILCLTNGENR